MKTLQNNQNLSYSKLSKVTNSISSKTALKLGLLILALAAYILLLSSMTELTLAGSAICFAAVVSFKSLKLDFEDINIDLEMSDIISDLEKDWR